VIVIGESSVDASIYLGVRRLARYDGHPCPGSTDISLLLAATRFCKCVFAI
jgi:hypothetical protein